MHSKNFHSFLVWLLNSVSVIAELVTDNGNIISSNDGYISQPVKISLFNDPSVLRFGNSSTSDYFKLLDLDGNHLLIGARDVVYNISIETFTEIHSIKWPSKESVVKECLMKGKSKDLCHNYVRILAKHNNDQSILICGTNAFQPMCRKYEPEKYDEYRQNLEFSGLGIVPYDPNHNSTFLRDDDLLYAGTVSDFSGADPLIHRRNITKMIDLGIRTERNDVKFLNEPNFVGSFRDNEYVYIWFREQAVERECCNDGAIYSRVARLCRSDNGGPRPYSNEWTSFVKARLNCSIPGHYPFYFDQIEAIAPPVNSFHLLKMKQLVYAVFRSPLAGISSSAICAFDIQQINDVFSESKYGDRSSSQSLWMSALYSDTSKYRPGKCANNSRLLPEEAVAFARSNPLMNEAIPNYFGAPIAIHTGLDHFTQIVIDAQVKAVDGHLYDVIFIGTDQGNIFKMVNLAGTKTTAKQPSHHIYTFQITNEPIQNMMIYQGNMKDLSVERYLIAVSERSVVRVPLAQCNRFETCTDCVALRDPHCAWDLEAKKCILLNNNLNGLYEQQVITGDTQGCGTFTELQHFFNFDIIPSIVNEHEEPLQDISYVLPLSNSAAISKNCSCEEKKSIPVCASTSNSFRVTAESTAYSLIEHSFFLPILCASIATFAIFIGFFVGNLYYRWKLSNKGKSSSCQSFSTTTPQPIFGTRLSSPSLSIINAYESISKFSGAIPLRSDSPISLMVEDLSHSSSFKDKLKQSKIHRPNQIYL
ncbi:Plexin repeat family protein [Brugia malayi]|uniref:Plexin repeat family protein n=1 Tax=Brugia malayi TaxID=6279 RepID=A0A4E9FGZ9_BRUMA|nr:Plexin repeat family protein [Brugia malayi]VIO95716.1 Plexin repeat family protein [Brugia malayi]